MTTIHNVVQSGWIVGVSVVFGLLFNYFFFDKLPPGIGFTIYIALIHVAFFGISHYSNRPVPRDLVWIFPLLFFFAAMVAVRSSILLTVLNMLACLGLLALIMEVSLQGGMRKFIPLDYLKLLWPFKVFAPLIAVFADILRVRHMTDKRNIKQIVRGVLITIPVIAIFSLLLANADPIFEKYTSLFTQWKFTEDDIVRIVLIAIVTIAAACFFSYAFTQKADTLPSRSHARPLGPVEIAILLSSVNALFLGFIAIQLTYLFGGESNIIAEGITYAEYARRGFFELVAVAVIAYLVLFSAEMFIEKDSEKHSQTFRILSSVLILQVGVIMISAFYRMWLYEEAFGFTTLRLYTHAFIILLGFIFACLLYKILVENEDSTFAFRTFLCIVIFVAGMNFFNPDAFIAQENIDRFAATGDLDTEYLSFLSADATPVLIKELSATNISEQMRNEIGNSLYKRNSEYKLEPWMSWNVARSREHKVLMQKAFELEKRYSRQ